jgi:hypothetical protein
MYRGWINVVRAVINYTVTNIRNTLFSTTHSKHQPILKQRSSQLINNTQICVKPDAILRGPLCSRLLDRRLRTLGPVFFGAQYLRTRPKLKLICYVPMTSHRSTAEASAIRKLNLYIDATWSTETKLECLVNIINIPLRHQVSKMQR